MQHILVLQNQGSGSGVAIVNDRLDFPVNLTGDCLAVTLRMGQVLADKHLIIVIVIADHADLIGHTVAGHHTAGFLGGFLDVAGRAGGDILEYDFLSDPSGNASICAGVGFPWPTSNGGTAKGTVYIDDIQVIPTPEEEIYTREGKHIVLRLHRDMVKITDKQADKWIKQLDKAYEAYADLLGETPYDGRKISILNTPGIEPGYWALAGNPILWNSHVAVTQALDNFHKEGDSCFGILHEIGHTFSAGTIGHPDNWNWNDEIFANFRMSYALEKNKTSVIMRDKKYTGAEIKNFYKLFYDETIGAGKPELNGDALHYTFLRIKDRFGWGLYKKAFRALYSLRESDMAHLDSPYKKFRFFIDQLSAQAGEDLYQTMYTPEERSLIERAFAAN